MSLSGDRQWYLNTAETAQAERDVRGVATTPQMADQLTRFRAGDFSGVGLLTTPQAQPEFAPRPSNGNTSSAHRVLTPATDKQISFVRKLMADRVSDVHMTDAEIESMSKVKASAAIDRLLKSPYKPREPRPAPKVTTHAPAPEFSDGMYRMPNGDIVKVQRAVNGSGNLYAKRLDTTAGSFGYVPGLIGRVRANGERMTLSEAKEYGKLYGMCIVCGRTLTDETSIAEGIGPICRKRV